jgi:hypothetical protein
VVVTAEAVRLSAVVGVAALLGMARGGEDGDVAGTLDGGLVPGDIVLPGTPDEEVVERLADGLDVVAAALVLGGWDVELEPVRGTAVLGSTDVVVDVVAVLGTVAGSAVVVRVVVVEAELGIGVLGVVEVSAAELEVVELGSELVDGRVVDVAG